MCKMKCKVIGLMVTMLMVCWSADAQHCHRGYWRRGNGVVLVTSAHVPKARVRTVTTHVSNRFSQKERLAMVEAYLDTHAALTVSRYAQMTGLSKLTAEVELDVFAMEGKNNIAVVVKGKKKIYEKDAMS